MNWNSGLFIRGLVYDIIHNARVLLFLTSVGSGAQFNLHPPKRKKKEFVHLTTAEKCSIEAESWSLKNSEGTREIKCTDRS